MLIAEVLVLLQIAHRRVTVHAALSRTVSYSLLFATIALAGAGVFQALGHPVDAVQFVATLILALLSATLFMALGDRLSSVVERVLFPAHARVARQLAIARGEQAALQRRLERAERLALSGELAASVAHEIKNPLAALRGYAELLAAGAGRVEPTWRASFEKAVRIIREEGDRIDARVAELLQQARTARMPARDSAVDINRVVLEAAVVLEREPGVSAITTRLDPGVGMVRGHEDEIRSALCNLLKNAAEAQVPAAGRIEVETRISEGYAVVEIRDEGHGLNGHPPEQLFQPFFTTRPAGTGLGLAIVRSAIEASGGSVSLHARPDRTGTIARVMLPLGTGASHV